MTPWIDSDALADQMRLAPCGCRRIEKASREEDAPLGNGADCDAERERGLAEARAWGCGIPFGNAPPAPTTDGLDDDHRDSLRGVKRCLKIDGLTTCPLWYARQPEVREAVDAWQTWKLGGPLSEEFGTPPGALMDAVREIESGVADRMRDDDERRRAAWEEKQQKRGSGDSGG